MNNKLTEIIFVLDESGSMGTVRDDVIGGFNRFIKDQKEIRGDVVMTIVKFDTRYNVVNQGALLENVKDLNNETYQPSGCTALLDAIGKTINEVTTRHATLPEDEKPKKVLLTVFTDGEENSSKEFTLVSEVSKLVKKKEKEGWEILFMGADIDAWADGGAMGFSRNVNLSKDDMSRNLHKMSTYTASYRTDDVTSLNTFDMTDEELDKQMQNSKNK
jgi:uncharacterized protein YegL